MTEKTTMPINCLKGIKASMFSPTPEQPVRTQNLFGATGNVCAETASEQFHPMVFDGATGSWKSSLQEGLQTFFVESKKT